MLGGVLHGGPGAGQRADDLLAFERLDPAQPVTGTAQEFGDIPQVLAMVLAARGDVKLHTAKYALDDFQSAIDDLAAGRIRGRAILTP